MEEIKKIPPVTRTLLFATLAVTLPSATLKLINPYPFILLWPNVLRGWQIWRPITAFFFGGANGLQLLFDLFLLLRNSTELEVDKYYRKTSEYAWALIVTCSLILATNYPLGSVVLFNPLLNAIVYLWSKANPHANVSLFGLITCPARYLPYAYLVFDLLRAGPSYAIQSATGLLSAHIYFFFKEVLPATNGGNGPRYIPDPPAFLRNILQDSPDPNARGVTPQPGGTVRTTTWGGTAFAPAGRSFGATQQQQQQQQQQQGGQSIGRSRGGLSSWFPFARQRQTSTSYASAAAQRANQPSREAILAAAEARLKGLRENSIAGRNQAASAAASQAADSAEARARTTGSSAQAGASTTANMARNTGVSSATPAQNGKITIRRLRDDKAKVQDEIDDEEQETASGSGGRVAEIRRKAPSTSMPDETNVEENSERHTWGSGRYLKD